MLLTKWKYPSSTLSSVQGMCLGFTTVLCRSYANRILLTDFVNVWHLFDFIYFRFGGTAVQAHQIEYLLFVLILNLACTSLPLCYLLLRHNIKSLCVCVCDQLFIYLFINMTYWLDLPYTIIVNMLQKHAPTYKWVYFSPVPLEIKKRVQVNKNITQQIKNKIILPPPTPKVQSLS